MIRSRNFANSNFDLHNLLALAFATLAAASGLIGCTSGQSGGSSPKPVAPTITTQPAAVSAFIGDSASFSVIATGTAPLTYQWLKGGTAVAGASSSTYTNPALVAADDATLYSVIVTNSAGSVTSSTAKLTVSVKPPSISTQPASISVTDSSTASFSVGAAGTAPLAYQWLRGGTAISGATSSTYSLAAAHIADSGSTFTVTVTNSAGTVTSASATLTVTAAQVAITTQPSAVSQFVGETATFAVVAAGTSPTYQWRKNGAAIAGATGISYTTQPLVAADDKSTFDVVVANTANSVTSDAASVKVGPFATVYTTQKGVKLNMYAWPGKTNAFLTKTPDYLPIYMRKILDAADSTYHYYEMTVGKDTSLYFNYDGLATIANTGIGGVDLCGAGCTFVGATGMELDDNTTAGLYAGVKNDLYNWVIFYEFGRSFWLFRNKLEYQSPDNSSCEVTGYAVYMGIHSLLAQNYASDYGTGIPNNPDPFKTKLQALDSYTADSSLNFQNTFQTSTFVSPYGDCPVLWSGLVQKLYLKYGGENFIQALFKEVLKRPDAATTQDAVDNFVLAASAATSKNLTYTFGTTWKWPISTSASQEAMSKWGSPE